MHITTNTTTSRRRVIQGIAWATPAVAATAAAPAFAASKCTPTISVDGGTAADWGNASRTTSNQQIAFGANVVVNNLPAGVTVTQVTERWFVDNPDSGATADGYWYPGNPYTNWYQSGQCMAVGCTMNWTKPIGVATQWDHTTAPNPGWSSTVTNTVNNQMTTFPDGVQRAAWDAILTWTPSAGSGITQGTGGCNNFSTSFSGYFGVNYYNAPTKATGYTVSLFAIVTVTLSNGQTIRYRTQTSTIKAAPVRL